ncbi:GrpB family protein [Marinicauda algicola]|nr:GrpB family protein [Marinicauda algicola]
MTGERIGVVDPRPEWADEGADWAVRVAEAFGAEALRVDHIGSTAVPDLPAKDVIDIQATVFRLQPAKEIAGLLTAAGFRQVGGMHEEAEVEDYEPIEEVPVWRKLLFKAPEDERAVTVHVRRNGAVNARLALLLRDYLRDDERARADYGRFKLAMNEIIDDPGEYDALKAPFLAMTMRAAEGWAELTRWVPGAPDAYWRGAE